MPPCSRCRMLQDGGCSAHALARKSLNRPIERPPIGACMIPIVEGYLREIQAGMSVLEVGCGTWDAVRSHCRKVGAYYDAIDSEVDYYGEPAIATRIENLSDLSFVDEAFDVVIGTQCMEHWAENGCSLRWGLHQCFRVCKHGGKVMLNVPIHYHGTRHFLLGDIGSIQRLFETYSTQVTLEEWGNPPDPLPPFYTYEHYWPLVGKHAYNLDIKAVKDRPMRQDSPRRWRLNRFLSRMVNYPLSFNMYRLLCKLGIIRSL